MASEYEAWERLGQDILLDPNNDRLHAIRGSVGRG
jgi:hypothetical protein